MVEKREYYQTKHGHLYATKEEAEEIERRVDFERAVLRLVRRTANWAQTPAQRRGLMPLPSTSALAEWLYENREEIILVLQGGDGGEAG